MKGLPLLIDTATLSRRKLSSFLRIVYLEVVPCPVESIGSHSVTILQAHKIADKDLSVEDLVLVTIPDHIHIELVLQLVNLQERFLLRRVCLGLHNGNNENSGNNGDGIEVVTKRPLAIRRRGGRQDHGNQSRYEKDLEYEVLEAFQEQPALCVLRGIRENICSILLAMFLMIRSSILLAMFLMIRSSDSGLIVLKALRNPLIPHTHHMCRMLTFHF